MTVRKSKQIYLGHLAILRASLLFLQLYFTGVGKKCIFGGGGLRGNKGIFHPSFHLLGPSLMLLQHIRSVRRGLDGQQEHSILWWDGRAIFVASRGRLSRAIFDG